jgi:thymidylate kinase
VEDTFKTSKRLIPKRGLFVCFAGLDGSGKTSHSKFLSNFLSKRGYVVNYTWSGTQPLFSYLFYGFTLLLGYWTRKGVHKNGYVSPLENVPTQLKKVFEPLLLLFHFMDFQIYCLIKIRFPLFFGKIVITDRYIYDLISGSTDLNSGKKDYLKFLLKTVPEPDLKILLDAPEEFISARRGTPINIIRQKRMNYSLLTRAMNFLIFDTSNDFTKNQNKIQKAALLLLENSQKFEGKN